MRKSTLVMAVGLLLVISSRAQAVKIPGLQPGTLVGNMSFAANPENLPIDPLGPSASEIQTDAAWPGGYIAPWGDNTTIVYTGEVFIGPSGVASFYENIDDQAWLEIDNELLFYNTAWDVPTAGTIHRPQGWYPFELRMSNGGGGAGAYADPTLGVGYTPTDTANSANRALYTWPHNTDEFTADLFRLRVLTALHWDELGSGEWGEIDGSGYSNWRDPADPGTPISLIPDAETAVTASATNPDTLYVGNVGDPQDRQAWGVDLLGGGLEIRDDSSLTTDAGALFASGTALAMGSNATLTVGQQLTADTTLTMGSNATLTVGQGGDVANLVVGAGPTIGVGSGNLVAGTFSDGGAATLVVKSGDGAFSLDNTAGAVSVEAGTQFKIEQGTLAAKGLHPLGASTQPVILDGGTYHVEGTRVVSVPAPGDNLVGEWTFNADDAADTSGNDHHGTVVGATFNDLDIPYTTAGKTLDLTGGDNYVFVDTNNNPDPDANQDVFDLDTFSVSAWVKGWPADWNPFVSKNGEGGGWQMRQTGGTSQLNWTTRGTEGVVGDNGDMTGVTDAVSDGDWHHVVMTIEADQSDLDPLNWTFDKKIYVDGALDAERIETQNPADVPPIGAGPGGVRDTGDVLAFGARNTGGPGGSYANFLDGKLDDVRVYSDVLTGPEIADMAGTLELDVSDTDLLVTGRSAVEVDYHSEVEFRSLTLMHGGGVATKGNVPGIAFATTTIDPGATWIGLSPEVPTKFAGTAGPAGLPGLDVQDRTLTIAKIGPGLWDIDAPATNDDHVTYEVAEGVLRPVGTDAFGGQPVRVVGGSFRLDAAAAPLGTSEIELAGGELLAMGLEELTDNVLMGQFYDVPTGVPANIEPIDAGSGVLTTDPDWMRALDGPLDFGDNTLQVYAGVPEDDYVAAWRGKLVVGGANLPAGDVTFGMRSDDGNVLYIDLNHDGDFQDADELIIADNADHGFQNVAGAWNLAAGSYDFVTAFYERAGGDGLTVKFGIGDLGTGDTGYNHADMKIINPTDPNQAGIWQSVALGTLDFTGDNAFSWSVTADSTLRAMTYQPTANFSAPLMKAGILTTTGPPAVNVVFEGVNIDPLATEVGFNPEVATSLGAIDGNLANVTVVKAGPRTLVLDTPAVEMGNATWEVREGTLKLEGTNILGGAAVHVLDGMLALDENADALGGAPVTLLGGTFMISGQETVTAENALLHAGFLIDNPNNRWSWDTHITDISGSGQLMVVPPTGTALLTNGPADRGLDFNNDADWRAAIPEITRDDYYMNLISGWLVAPVDGDYQFDMDSSDDIGIIWVDLDQNGIFQRAGALGDERLAWEDHNPKTVTLTQGDYRVAFLHAEFGGGSNFDVSIQTPLMSGEAMIKPAAQPGLWKVSDFGPITATTGLSWTVDGDSTFVTQASGTATVAGPTMKSGILTITGPAEKVVFSGGVTIDPSATEVGFDPRTSTDFGTIDAGGADVTIVKAGGSTWDTTGMTAPSNIQNASWEIREGTMKLTGDASVLGGAPVVLAGGKLSVWGTLELGDETANALHHYGYMLDGRAALDDNRDPGIPGAALSLDGNGGLLAINPVGTSLFTTGPGDRGLDFNNDADWRAAVPEITRDDDYQNLIHGVFIAPETGVYQFRRDSDDDKVFMWIDKDQDFVFERNGDRGNELLCWEEDWIHSLGLVAGEEYRMAFGHAEHTGGSHLDIRFRTPTLITSRVTIKPADPAQAGMWKAVDGSFAAFDMSGVPVSVTADSAFDVNSAGAVSVGPLTLVDGMLTIQGLADAVSFDGTTIDAEATAVGVDMQLPTDLGLLDGSLASATFTKSGPVDLVLRSRDTTAVDNLTFAVAGGRLVGLIGWMEGINDENPFSDTSSLQINSGELVLASEAEGLNVTYENPLAVEGDGTLTASPGGIGVAGPLTVTLGSPTEGVTLNSGTLSVQALDRYQLHIPGTVSGPGNMDMVVGDVTVDQTINIGDLNILGGTLRVGDAITADNLNVSGRLKLTASGREHRSITVNSGGALSLDGASLNMEGGTLLVPEAEVNIGFGRTLIYDQALTVGSLNLGGTLTMRGPTAADRGLTVTPGGKLAMSPDTFLNMSGLTESTLTVADSDIEVKGAELTLDQDFDVRNITIANEGSIDANGHFATVHGYLEVDRMRVDGGGLPFQVRFSNPEVQLDGNTLNIEGARPGTSDALLHYGYHINNDALALDLDNNGGMMGGGDPTTFQSFHGYALLTDGPGGRGLDFDNDADFINTGAIGQNDNYSNLFVGFFTAPAAGNFQFRNAGDDDSAGIWLDLDQDGVFESTTPGLGSNRGEQLSWEDGGTKTVALTGGAEYLIAFTHREGGGGSRCDFRFQTPAMGSEVIIKPADAAQAGLWSAVVPGTDLVIDMPNVDFRLTATSTLNLEAPGTAILGNLMMENGANLETSGEAEAVGLNNVTNTEDAAIVAAVLIRGVISPGGDGGLATLTVGDPAIGGGGLELADYSEYACDVGQSMANDMVVSIKDSYLSGTLTLRPLSKLEPPVSPGVDWYGYQTRTVLGTTGEPAVSYTFINVPEAQPETWYIQDVVDSGTGEILHPRNWEQGHLNHGVFLTRETNTMGDDDPDDELPDQPGITYLPNATQANLFQAANGDTNGDRLVASQDIQNILGFGEYLTGNPATWPQGDFNGSDDPDDPDLPPGAANSIGFCNSYDIQLILATGLWPPQDPPVPYAAPPQRKLADGDVELLVVPGSDGTFRLQIDTHGLAINSYAVYSADGVLGGEDAANLGLFTQDDDFVIAGVGLSTLLAGAHDLGAVIGPGLDGPDGLALTYTVQGAAGLYRGEVVMIPEPGTLAMLIAGGLGLLLLAIRRRRTT